MPRASARPVCLAAALAVLPTLLVAQTTVTFPSDHANLEGQYSSTNFPYAYGVSRLQAVYEAWDLGIAPGTPITRIGVRQNGTQSAVTRSVQVEVRMGYTMHTAANLGTNFDNNYVGAPQTVFGPALFALPQLNTTQPGQQAVWLNITTPFTYQPANGNLVIEWRVIANNNGNAAFSYPLDRATFYSPVTASSSPGCPHSGNATATLTSSPAAAGSNWNIAVNSAPASSFVFLGIDVGGTLVPSFSLQPYVAGIDPACVGTVNPLNLSLATALTNAQGYYRWTVAVPNSLSFNNLRMASQALIPDFFAPGGVVTSNGDQIEFGIDPAQTFLVSQGNVNASTGTLYANYGLVTLFQ